MYIIFSIKIHKYLALQKSLKIIIKILYKVNYLIITMNRNTIYKLKTYYNNK